MNQTHLHLVLNHFPIVGTIIGSALLLWGLIGKKIQLQKAAAVVLVVMSFLAIPVFFTGEAAEHTVENIGGISESLIEAHEEAAKISIWLMVVSGLTALFALFIQYKRKEGARSYFITTFLVSLVAFGAIAWTGFTGGQVRHSEIASNAGISAVGGQQENEKAGGQQSKREEGDD